MEGVKAMEMREILFRGKRVDNGEWVKGAYGNHTSFDAMIMDRPYPTINGDLSALNFWVVDPTTIGQFTGLTDKNGNRIFEGDIVEYDNVNYEIKYIEGFAAFDLRSVDNMNYAPRITTNTVPRMSVIGNIHDNPELLEGSNV